jgi:hypothetical protein
VDSNEALVVAFAWPFAARAITVERVVVNMVSRIPWGTLFRKGCTTHINMAGTERESDMNSTCIYTPPSFSSRCQKLFRRQR